MGGGGGFRELNSSCTIHTDHILQNYRLVIETGPVHVLTVRHLKSTKTSVFCPFLCKFTWWMAIHLCKMLLNLCLVLNFAGLYLLKQSCNDISVMLSWKKFMAVLEGKNLTWCFKRWNSIQLSGSSLFIKGPLQSKLFLGALQRPTAWPQTSNISKERLPFNGKKLCTGPGAHWDEKWFRLFSSGGVRAVLMLKCLCHDCVTKRQRLSPGWPQPRGRNSERSRRWPTA